MIELISKGGFMMYPLLLASIISLAIIIERLAFFHKNLIDERRLMEQLSLEIKHKNYSAALQICQRYQGPVARILSSAIKKFPDGNYEDIEKTIEKETLNEIPAIERYIPGLAVIASVSTLMGFTGTVTGMIRAFGDIAARGVSSPAVVASGISEALITTAAGLIIAIPTMLFYHYFTYRVGRLTFEIEKCANELLEIKSGK